MYIVYTPAMGKWIKCADRVGANILLGMEKHPEKFEGVRIVYFDFEMSNFEEFCRVPITQTLRM